jgi:hypothetical protein
MAGYAANPIDDYNAFMKPIFCLIRIHNQRSDPHPYTRPIERLSRIGRGRPAKWE